MKYILAPSILSADFNELAKDIKLTEDNGAVYLHFDVMDGMFVPNISFGIPVMKSIRKSTNQVMDAHLITVHYEACFRSNSGNPKDDYRQRA